MSHTLYLDPRLVIYLVTLHSRPWLWHDLSTQSVWYSMSPLAWLQCLQPGLMSSDILLHLHASCHPTRTDVHWVLYITIDTANKAGQVNIKAARIHLEKRQFNAHMLQLENKTPDNAQGKTHDTRHKTQDTRHMRGCKVLTEHVV